MPPFLTQTQEVYLTQKDFTKIFKIFEKHPNVKNYNLITKYLSKKISFTALTNPTFSFYLSNNKGKIIVSNINNNFSTFTDYTANINFLNISEKSEFLNNLGTVQKTNETNVNLLQEPALNVILNAGININNINKLLYYTVQRRQPCEKYILTGFLYDNFVIPTPPA